MGLLKWAGSVLLAIIFFGVILGIVAFIHIIKMIVAGILLLAFLTYLIRCWFRSRKQRET